MKANRVLDLGCGRRKTAGALGVDHVALPGVDVVAEFDGVALPFRDDSFTRIVAHHVLEHIRDLPGLMAELHRVARPGAVIDIIVPYFPCVGAFGDPTHVRFFTYYTLDHFTTRPDLHSWFSDVRFEIRSRHIGFGRLHRLLGIGWLANRFPHVYENFFAFWFPGRTLQVEMIIPTSRNLQSDSSTLTF